MSWSRTAEKGTPSQVSPTADHPATQWKSAATLRRGRPASAAVERLTGAGQVVDDLDRTAGSDHWWWPLHVDPEPREALDGALARRELAHDALSIR